jgi:hypothetical protein
MITNNAEHVVVVEGDGATKPIGIARAVSDKPQDQRELCPWARGCASRRMGVRPQVHLRGNRAYAVSRSTTS